MEVSLKKSTEELLNLIQKASDIEYYIKENESEMLNISLDVYLSKLLEENNLKIADVMAKSEQGDYIYKVFKNQRKASRDILISIAIGMELDINQAQKLLRISKNARLDPREKRDSVIIYAITNNISVCELNDILYDIGERTL